MLCALCDTPLTHRKDEFYFICDSCKALVKDKKFYLNEAQERARYEEHNNDVHDSGYQQFTSPITQYILEKYTHQHVGLDYGCGKGPVISTMLQKHGYSIQLFDPFFYPSHDYLNQRCNYIFSCEVFEHFHDPKGELKKLLDILKPGGRLLIMTHLYRQNIDFAHWYYRNDPTHVFIYTEKTMLYIAKTYDLELEYSDERLVVFVKK